MRHARRCERLVHAELFDMPHVENVTVNCQCDTQHKEYYKAPLSDIEAVVKKYVAHMRSTYGDGVY